MQQIHHQSNNEQDCLNTLRSNLDAFMSERLSFDDLRTQWITALSSNPGTRDSALRLLYQKSSSDHLPEQKILSLKRIVESAYDDDPDDWTVEMDEDDRIAATPSLIRDSFYATELAVAGAKRAESIKIEPYAPRSEDRVAVSISDSPNSGLPSLVGTGTILNDRFVLGELLGTGGTGLVYSARDLLREAAGTVKDEVAIKILRSEFWNTRPRIESMRHEAIVTQSLSHPNIARVYDFHMDDAAPFLTMELLDGEILKALLKRIQPSAVARESAIKIVLDLCRGLAHVHTNGFVHGDLKPGNIFLTSTDQAKILDFGLAGLAAPGARSDDAMPYGRGSSARANTPAYASCNRLSGGDPLFSDDVYSLSCVVYELLSGQHPYQREPATTARERGLQPSRIEGLTDLQWRTLAAGLQLSNTQPTSLLHDFLEAFGEPSTPDSSRIPANKRRSGLRVPFAVAVAFLGGAGLMLAMVSLGIQPIDQQHVELLRESKFIQSFRSATGIATGETATHSPPALAAPEEDTTLTADSVRDPESGLVPLDIVQDAAGGRPPTSADGAVPRSVDESILPGEDPQLVAGISPSSTVVVPLPSSVAPGFQLGSAAYFIEEGAAALAVEIKRQGSATGPVYVLLTTIDGSAKSDDDFVPFNEYPLRFEVGEASRTLFIPIVADAMAEGDELFGIALGTTNAEMILAEPSNATVTIVDDDA